MVRNRVIQLVSVLVMAACLGAVWLFVPPILQTRRDLQMGFSVEQARSLPPDIAVSNVALSIFRGLAVDIMAYRLDEMKMQGKFHEANQLSEFITRLQPRFPRVWQFYAWNMAYNISVATHTPDERWEWVNKGIRLIRDRGLIYNPRSVALYREISWIFLHKVAGMTDDMHWHYKRMLAMEWQELLGNPAEGATTEQVMQALRLIINAPQTHEQLLASDPRMSELLRVIEIGGYKLDERLLRDIGKLRMTVRSRDAQMFGYDLSRLLSWMDPNVGMPMLEPQNQPALELLLSHLRKKVLHENYNMDPVFMLKLVQPVEEGGYDFGPLDWRHPATHSLYWTVRGIEVVNERLHNKHTDITNTYRGANHAIQALVRAGRISFDPLSPGGPRIDLMPDPRFIPAYERAYFAVEDAIEKGIIPEMSGSSFQTGRENLLRESVMFLYLYGDIEEAQRYMLRLRERYNHDGRYDITLPELVVQAMQANIERREDARQFIDAMLRRSFVQGVAIARADVYSRYMSLARYVYDQYHKDKLATPTAGQDREAMPPFEIMLEESYIGYIQDVREDIRKRIYVWHSTPPWLQLKAYPRVQTEIIEQLRRYGLDPDVYFPPPEGWQQQQQQPPAAPPVETAPTESTIQRN